MTDHDCQALPDAESAVETAPYIAFVSRILAAASRRVGRGHIGSLSSLVELRAEIDAAIAGAVTDLHELHQYSWAQIGAAL